MVMPVLFILERKKKKGENISKYLVSFDFGASYLQASHNLVLEISKILKCFLNFKILDHIRLLWSINLLPQIISETIVNL
jgi:hypothetical protein